MSRMQESNWLFGRSYIEALSSALTNEGDQRDGDESWYNMRIACSPTTARD